MYFAFCVFYIIIMKIYRKKINKCILNVEVISARRSAMSEMTHINLQVAIINI